MASAMPPVVEISPGGCASKRKRDITEEEGPLSPLQTAATNPPKRVKVEVPTGSESKSEASSVEEKPTKTTVVGADKIRNTFDAQFSLEILLKHEELRLINQELAKCQVALEQLRRCHLIPYPTSQDTYDAMLNISNGTGPSLKQEGHVPQWAAPYGVTDGPYTRHYAKWLIPDPSFDGDQFEAIPSRASKTLIEGRSTRHSIADATTPLTSNKSRIQRGSTGQKLQALSSGYPGAKATGPSFVKRKDGQLVKLVCINCNREDFSSTQGFINHVRIAHKVEYKSHEEAAIACGQPVENDEIHVVSEVQQPTPANGLVHPLIRSTPVDRDAYISLLSHINTSLSLFEQGKLPGVTEIPGSTNSSPLKKTPLKSKAEIIPNPSFVPSSTTPHLSALMARRGLSGNLTDMVGEAKQPINFDDLSYDEEDSGDDENPPPTPVGGIGSLDRAASPDRSIVRIPARAPMSPSMNRFNSDTLQDTTIPDIASAATPTRFCTTFIDTAAANRPCSRLSHSFDGHIDIDGDVNMMMGPSLTDLSPNTVASNSAPSLVSDDGEYDDGDDAESHISEDEGSDVAEFEIDDGGEVVVPRVRSENSGRKEDKHVSFVSPVKEKKQQHAARK